MYGALLGDMIGAPYEFDRGTKTKVFELFTRETHITDDSIMTTAVADALLGLPADADDIKVKEAVIFAMQSWGDMYPDAGYGNMFCSWLRAEDPEPYGSYGNGAAMRVSPAGWLYDSLEETRRYARLTAEVTHNHPEGIKGAEATASAIYLARTGSTKGEIKEYIVQEFGYDLSRTCDEIRPDYYHDESCMRTVPEAIIAFMESEDFEDTVRTAVSLGGDTDTLACIAGSIGEAYFGIPDKLRTQCLTKLTPEIQDVVDRFYERVGERAKLWVS